jgi:hypothetical protein
LLGRFLTEVTVELIDPESGNIIQKTHVSQIKKYYARMNEEGDEEEEREEEE